MMEFERIVKMYPAYDKRNSDPKKDGGIHGVSLAMSLKGSKGAVVFSVFTNWHLPHVQEELDKKHIDHFCCHPLPADLGYHSLEPMWEGDTPLREKCPFLDGKPCYYDGSSLAANEMFKVLLEKGSEGIWEELETYYRETFE